MRAKWMLGLVILALLLAGCRNVARTLPDDEAQAFADQVDAMSENLLTALNNQDYAAYTQDMDEQMREVVTEAQFQQAYDTIIGKIGKYVSRERVQVIEQDKYRAVIYDAQFEQEEHVTVRVVYNVSGDQPLVSGLWLDSPKLREQ